MTGERAETGPMQFGGDWTGIFIRGDDAFRFMHALHFVLEGQDPTGIYTLTVRSLVDLFGSANEMNTESEARQRMKPFVDVVQDGTEETMRFALMKIQEITEPALLHSENIAKRVHELATAALEE